MKAEDVEYLKSIDILSETFVMKIACSPNSIQPSGKIFVNSHPTESKPRGPSYDEDLLTLDESKFPIKLQNTEYGILPLNALDISTVISKVDISDFYNMPNTKDFTLISKDGEISLHAKGTGNSYNPIISKQSIKNVDIRISLNSDKLERLVNNMDGECWILFGEHAIFITKVSDNISILLMQSTQEPESN